MTVRNDLKCPSCDRKLYEYEPRIPVVGICKCGQRSRLVNGQFITWPAWLRIKSQITVPTPDQQLLRSAEVIVSL